MYTDPISGENFTTSVTTGVPPNDFGHAVIDSKFCALYYPQEGFQGASSCPDSGFSSLVGPGTDYREKDLSPPVSIGDLCCCNNQI
mmetsp:Transcript_15474/g.24197  ORF Transcript_15474/g.24197 Transcript_15474/m.24197 type:complete len:86 (+) Transcript_15474:241-498(+)